MTNAQNGGRFCWHPSARVFGPDGVGHGAAHVTPQAVIAEKPSLLALQTAFASAAAGVTFRIGATDADAPAPSETPAFETLTGGSTGSPRRILRSQASWTASFLINAPRFGIAPGAGVAVLGSLSHSIALYAALEALHLGADLHLFAGCSPARQCRDMRSRGVATLYATPVQLRLLAESGPPPVTTLRHLVVGGGALDPGLRARLFHLFPTARVHTFYGAAETSFIALSDNDTPDGAAGPPYPGVDIRVQLPDGTPAPDPAGPGEVWVRSPYLAMGYAGPDAGSARWVDGWVSVGEWGHLSHGHLHILGRASRMIRIADQSVFPEEIEAFLATQPGIRDAAVIACPDPRRGQVLEAVLRGDTRVEQAVLAAARQRFGLMAAPRRAHWRTDWPLLPSGKVDLAAIDAALT